MTARGPGADLGLGLVRLRRPNPVLAVWRWRYELGLVAATVAARALVGALWTVQVGLALGSLTAAVPELRRRARGRAWCVVTPHRVRTACKHAWIHSRTGRIPAVLWTSPVAEGEQLLLWCRAGTTAEDLEVARPLIATACWARDVRVVPHTSRTHLVLLTVVRAQDLPPETAA